MACLATVTLMLTGLCACGNKTTKQEDMDWEDMPERSEDNRDVVTQIGSLHTENTVSYNGHSYSYSINRQPLDSVIITDDEGYKAQDNTILLTIQRDGAPFFERRFTRSSFHINVSESYYRQCILLGMNFDCTSDYGLCFIASIGKGADSEDYKPYTLTVGPDGSTNITEHDLYGDDEVNRFEDEGV